MRFVEKNPDVRIMFREKTSGKSSSIGMCDTDFDVVTKAFIEMNLTHHVGEISVNEKPKSLYLNVISGDRSMNFTLYHLSAIEAKELVRGYLQYTVYLAEHHVEQNQILDDLVKQNQELLTQSEEQYNKL